MPILLSDNTMSKPFSSHDVRREIKAVITKILFFFIFLYIILLFCCKSNILNRKYLQISYIPLKLTIAKAIVLREATLPWGLISYIYMELYIFAIGLYIHIGIMFFVYCVVCLLFYCMLEAWEY